MTSLPRYREPMIGWPHDADICEHGMPVDACESEHGDEIKTWSSKTVRRVLIDAEVAAAEPEDIP